MPQILDGTAVRNDILERLKPRIAKLKRRPGLAVVLVGHNPASEVYVRSKIKACAETNIFSEKIAPPETVTTEEMLAIVAISTAAPTLTASWCRCPCPSRWI